MKIIEAQFELDDEEDGQAHGDAYGQSGHIDDGEIPASPQVAKGGLEIVLDHGVWFVNAFKVQGLTFKVSKQQH
jgi:hypothetical protein